MVELQRKYRLNIVVLVVLIGLLFFFIPNEEDRRYLQLDFKAIKEKSHSVVLLTVAVLIVVLFLFGLRQLKKKTDIFYLVLGLGCMAVGFFFFFSSISFVTISFINRLSKSQRVEKLYKVAYVDNGNKNLLLWDNSLNESVRADQII